MIEFHLDARSGLSPYQQLVQQVRHALRLGLLNEETSSPRSRTWSRASRSTPTPC